MMPSGSAVQRVAEQCHAVAVDPVLARMPMQPADRGRRVDQKVRELGIGEQAVVRDRDGETAAAQNVREKAIAATGARGPAAAIEEDDEAAFPEAWCGR